MVSRTEEPMAAESHRFKVESKGNSQVLDITDKVAECLASGRIRDGVATVFVVGSTAAVTTTEFEPGLVEHDLGAAFERIAPAEAYYHHHETWGDDNGHAHVRASLIGPSLAVPLVGGKLTLGTWQQIVLIDFDTRPRKREIVVQVVG
jgi:secondary thiamine-phosphate synthase enzyme